MDSKFQALFELSRDPIVAVEGGKLSYMNRAAHRLYSTQAIGKSASLILPESILSADSDNYVSSATICERTYSVRAIRSGKSLILAFIPDSEPDACTSFLNDGFINSALDSLFEINMSLDLIRDRLPDPDEKSSYYLSVLYRNCRQLTRQMSNLSMAVSLMNGRLEIFARSTDIVKLCSNVCEASSFLTGGSSAKIAFSSTENKIIACVDRQKIQRLLFNLISNSVKNTPPDGLIRVEAHLHGSDVVIGVTDNGRGIPPDILRHLFARGSASLSVSDFSELRGGGLGLLISRGIAERHKGTLLLESREGQGTSVHVSLPLARSTELVFRDGDSPEDDLLPIALTELSDVINTDLYTGRYMD